MAKLKNIMLLAATVAISNVLTTPRVSDMFGYVSSAFRSVAGLFLRTYQEDREQFSPLLPQCSAEDYNPKATYSIRTLRGETDTTVDLDHAALTAVLDRNPNKALTRLELTRIIVGDLPELVDKSGLMFAVNREDQSLTIVKTGKFYQPVLTKVPDISKAMGECGHEPDSDMFEFFANHPEVVAVDLFRSAPYIKLYIGHLEISIYLNEQAKRTLLREKGYSLGQIFDIIKPGEIEGFKCNVNVQNFLPGWRDTARRINNAIKDVVFSAFGVLGLRIMRNDLTPEQVFKLIEEIDAAVNDPEFRLQLINPHI